MRLHVLSDLHQEFDEVDVPSVDCDCVVLAGDVSTKQHGLEWISRRFSNVPVIYICGNHEFYGEKTPSLIEKLRAQSVGTNIHFLENEFVTINGIHFFGCTLWTDMALQGDWLTGAAEVAAIMNDYKRTRNSSRGYKRLSPRDTRLMHMASIEAMSAFFQNHDPSKCVIVSHHAPSLLSLPDKRRSELISCAYASHLDEFILRHQPHLWIHGHIHCSSDYHIGKTRILSNPRAYPDAPNGEFIPDLIAEVSE